MGPCPIVIRDIFGGAVAETGPEGRTLVQVQGRSFPQTSLLVPWFFVRRPFSALGAVAVLCVELLLLLGAALGSERLVVSHSASVRTPLSQPATLVDGSSGPVAQLARTAATLAACGGRLVLHLLL